MSGYIMLNGTYEGRQLITEADNRESVASFVGMLSQQLRVPAEQLRVYASSGKGGKRILLEDDKAMLEYGFKKGDSIMIERVVSLADVASAATALVSENLGKALFLAAIPAVLYLGLRRRELKWSALTDAFRLPFMD